MLSRRGVAGRFVVLAGGILLGGLAAGPAAEPGDAKALAEEIRKTSGVVAGLCVHLGCGDGRLTAELAGSGKLLVHGLAADQKTVEKARERVQARGLYGRASVDRADFGKLPYADNLVNLVVADDLDRLLKQGLALSEVARILCPGGVAYLGQTPGPGAASRQEDLKAKVAAAGMKGAEIIKRDGLWVKFEKPRPEGMDAWTHPRHGPDGNLVSRDTLAVPAGLRWAAGPIWSEAGWSRVALTAGGRLFAIVPDEMHVVARDAYNGLLLWKRSLAPWGGNYHRRPQLLAAAEDRLFAWMEGKLQALDVTTGQTLLSYDTAEPPQRAVAADGLLVVASRGGLQAFAARKNQLRWKHQAKVADVVAGQGRVFFLDITRTPYELVSLDLATGAQRWRTSTEPFGPPTTTDWAVGSGRRAMNVCFYQDGILALLSGEGHSGQKNAKVHAVAAKDGKHLWTHPYPLPPVHAAIHFKDILFQGGLIWLHAAVQGNCFRGNVFEGLDPATGETKRRLKLGSMRVSCQPDLATSRYIFAQKHFAFVDLKTGKLSQFAAAGGACGAGGIIGNGLWYALPFGCGCNPVALQGYLALAPAEGGQPEPGQPDTGPRLEPGPAAGAAVAAEPPRADDWPTYRRDPWRSAATPSKVPGDLKVIWKAKVDAAPAESADADWKGLGYRRITAPTVAEGKVFVSVPEIHRVVALDAGDGKVAWNYTTGGRLDMPPTIHKGLCLTGCRDGWVYCLRAQDGKMVWRFRAAPRQRRIPAYGQMESVWPVCGSVLVDKDLAFFTAGRSSGADGGLVTFALEPRTGKVVWAKPPRDARRSLKGLDDTLASDGTYAYLRQWRFNLTTGENHQALWVKPRPVYLLAGRLGIADDSWTTTPWSYWHAQQRRSDNRGTRGQLLVLTADRTYSYRVWTPEKPKAPPELFAQGFQKESKKGKLLWRTLLPRPIQVEALVLAGDVLLAAGPADVEVRKKGFVMALSAADGRRLGQWALPAPSIYEGLTVAGGRVYVSTEDGKVLCLGSR